MNYKNNKHSELEYYKLIEGTFFDLLDDKNEQLFETRFIII